jgi:hypothetical protein
MTVTDKLAPPLPLSGMLRREPCRSTDGAFAILSIAK